VSITNIQSIHVNGMGRGGIRQRRRQFWLGLLARNIQRNGNQISPRLIPSHLEDDCGMTLATQVAGEGVLLLADDERRFEPKAIIAFTS
jgi:hypothetical protein